MRSTLCLLLAGLALLATVSGGDRRKEGPGVLATPTLLLSRRWLAAAPLSPLTFCRSVSRLAASRLYNGSRPLEGPGGLPERICVHYHTAQFRPQQQLPTGRAPRVPAPLPRRPHPPKRRDLRGEGKCGEGKVVCDGPTPSPWCACCLPRALDRAPLPPHQPPAPAPPPTPFSPVCSTMSSTATTCGRSPTTMELISTSSSS